MPIDEGFPMPPAPTLEDLQADPHLTARRQDELALDWATLYADPTATHAKAAAAIALANPAAYSHDVDLSRLPADVQQQWQFVLESAATVANRAVINPIDWNDTNNSLDNLQSLVNTDNVRIDQRAAVAKIMQQASAVFTRSINFDHGNIAYYAENVVKADASLRAQVSVA